MSPRNNAALRSSRSRSSVEADNSSIARNDAAATTGVIALENRYGRERCRNSATISRRPLV